jgi:hypothetical protein
VTQNNHKRRAEAFDGELDASNLGGRYDVTGDPDNEEITQALIEDDLCWYA